MWTRIQMVQSTITKSHHSLHSTWKGKIVLKNILWWKVKISKAVYVNTVQLDFTPSVYLVAEKNKLFKSKTVGVQASSALKHSVGAVTKYHRCHNRSGRSRFNSSSAWWDKMLWCSAWLAHTHRSRVPWGGATNIWQLVVSKNNIALQSWRPAPVGFYLWNSSLTWSDRRTIQNLQNY
jgi:hypothetical protein